MTVVTNLQYHLETRLIKKLDLMAERCTNKKVRRDSVLIIEGAEGEGKTNSSLAVGYYIKSKTGMPMHMFFRLKPLIEFAKSTESKIIIWDEPALDSLSSDWWKETNKDLIRLLMTCRKKRHFFIFNFVKFYKFPEYVVVDRALGFIHMYSKRELRPGRFVYIKKKNLEKLFNDYRKKKLRNYKVYTAFHGAFPVVEKYMDKMGLTINDKTNCSLEDYEDLKDKSINSIGRGEKKKSPKYLAYQRLKHLIGVMKTPIKTRKELCEKLEMSTKTLSRWSKIDPVELDSSHKTEIDTKRDAKSMIEDMKERTGG